MSVNRNRTLVMSPQYATTLMGVFIASAKKASLEMDLSVQVMLKCR
jgi:hypothetical protein